MVLEDITHDEIIVSKSKKFKYTVESMNIYEDILTDDNNSELYMSIDEMLNVYCESLSNMITSENIVYIFPYQLFIDQEFRQNIFFYYDITYNQLNQFNMYLDYYIEIIIHSNFHKYLRNVYIKYSYFFTSDDCIYDFILNENKYFLNSIGEMYIEYFSGRDRIDKKFQIKGELEEVD